MIDELIFPHGLQLLHRWQAGDADARARLKEIFDDAIDGKFDDNFAVQAPVDAVNIGGSINLLTLNIMNDLYGYESAEFYKVDMERYVRTTLLTRRLLGMNKLYVSWAVYGFTAEALGQAMMYPDKFPPGSDPELVLVDKGNWRDIKTPDFTTGIPKIIDEIIETYVRITGMDPLIQLSAPYSLLADIYGQEPLLADLVNDPDRANAMLDHLVDHVLQPWIAHFFAKYPNGWAELSDASGSPFFIGPKNCKNMAIRTIMRLKDENPWGDRVYDANYRGDYVTQAQQKSRSSRRRGRGGEVEAAINLEELTALKHSVCTDYVIRLDDDKVDVGFYEKAAIERNVPLFTGIGAGQVDRNSVKNLEIAKVEIQATAETYVKAIRNVANTISANGYDNKKQPWPGTLYFEDVSSEAQFEMIEILVGEALKNGAL